MILNEGLLFPESPITVCERDKWDEGGARWVYARLTDDEVVFLAIRDVGDDDSMLAVADIESFRNRVCCTLLISTVSFHT